MPLACVTNGKVLREGMLVVICNQGGYTGRCMKDWLKHIGDW